MSKFTPMIEQYLEVKAQHQDAILFFRLGDFYEMFFEDAVLAARELEIVLTARDGGLQQKIPMCGIPYHAVNNYLPRLISRGYKVAICEQVEDPKQASGIVKREVIRIISPGTILEDFMLDEGVSNYLAAVDMVEDTIGFAYIDISTGEFKLTEMKGRNALADLQAELQRVAPAECLLSARLTHNSLWEDQPLGSDFLFSDYPEPDLDPEHSRQILADHFGQESLDDWGISGYHTGMQAAAMIISFLYNTQKSRLLHLDSLQIYQSSDYMELDSFTRRNLELTATIRQNRKEGSLLDVLDHCRTPMGKRNLRRWLEQPLMNMEAIEKRLDGVEELFSNIGLRQSGRDTVNKIYDLERLCGKLGSPLLNPRDLLALKQSLALLPAIKEVLSDSRSDILREIAGLNELAEVHAIIESTIDEEAPLTVREGGIIKRGYRPEIDELKALSAQGKDFLLDYENREKARTGMKYLKVSYNKVFGYYIEVSKSNLNMVPADYIRKQTLVNTERYITEELKNYEDKIVGAYDKLCVLEYDCFVEIKQKLEPFIPAIQASSKAVADFDCLLALAQVAYMNDYVRPQLSRDGRLEIKGGRHPVVEKSLQNIRFIPNDILLDSRDNRFAIITGPNMGGKSTYMRQAALINIMAQIGSFVPAGEAKVSIVDRVFTRVGAADDLAAGQSTFMVEMVELAHILNHATANSLIILDEIGRGTSTYDGLSIAQAASEYIHDKVKARTLFATHYHEITRLAEEKSGIVNLSVSVMESAGTVTFLKKVLPGKADKSYGIHVAQMAGLPRAVIDRAYEVLATLENLEKPARQAVVQQISLFGEEPNEILEELDHLDLDNLNAREALMILYRWQEKRRR
ncbi:MAG TPA: DNA mismatch repair protein MutS [Syntrophomonas sp.]|nr:DNA mismatch repair protein MutS [Syntrophomonas sp.]